MSESAIIGTIRCRCGSRMEVLEEEATTTPEGICYTTECLECLEKGGYNAATLEVYGATDRLEIVGE